MKGYFLIVKGSIIFKTNKHKLPLILAGVFNVNFARAESMPLMTFLQKEFQLQINNNPRESTTKYGTTIDAVFVRYLDNVLSNTFVKLSSTNRHSNTGRGNIEYNYY